MSTKLSQEDIHDAADFLGVSPAHVHALLEVESLGSGFDKQGKVKFLFEPHKFSQHTRHRFDQSHPDVSWREWKPGGYGTQADNQRRFAQAVKLDENAAYLASSWGMAQILGSNATTIGYASAKEMALSFQEHGEPEQLRAFVRLIDEWDLAPALRRNDWATVARRYNGKSYQRNDYDGKLARAFAKWRAKEGKDTAPDVGDYQLQIPDLSPQVASPPNVAAAQFAQTPEPPLPASSETVQAAALAPAQSGAVNQLGEARVYLQSLGGKWKPGKEEIIGGLTVAWTWLKANPEKVAVYVGMIVAAVVIYKMWDRWIKLQVDKAVIETHANPAKVSVKPDKEAK